MEKKQDLSNFYKLSDESKKQRIDEINEFIYYDLYKGVGNEKQIIQKLHDCSKELDYTRGIAFSELNLGNYFCSLESYEGIPHLNKSLALFKKIGDSRILRSLLNLGSSYMFASLYNRE